MLLFKLQPQKVSLAKNPSRHRRVDVTKARNKRIYIIMTIFLTNNLILRVLYPNGANETLSLSAVCHRGHFGSSKRKSVEIFTDYLSRVQHS